MQLCTSCKAYLSEGAKFCSQCGQVVPAAFVPDSSSFAYPPSLPSYTTVKESTSTYKSPITPVPFTPEDGVFLPSVTYTTAPPSPDYTGTNQSSALNKDTPLPSLYPFDNPYIDSPAPASQTDATIPPQLSQKITMRPHRGWIRWLLVALVCLLVSSGVVGAFQVKFHLPIPNPPRGTPAPLPPNLNVQPSILDFGSVPKGSKVILAVLVANTGKNKLQWSANAGSAGWLGLAGTKAGSATSNQAQQIIYSVVDTSGLAAGNYSSTEQIASNAGIAHIPIKLHVVTFSGKKQAKLNVNPSLLNLGTLLINQQTSALLTLGNTGTQNLTWKASTGNAHWLALDHNSGTVATGGLPQALKITANTAHLLPGSYSTLLNITSNGGNFQVGVTLVVSSSMSPINSGLLNVSPSNFMNGCLSCIVTLSSPTNARGNVNWKATGMGLNGIRFNPASGTLLPGRSVQVTASVPNVTCPASAVFSFSGSANTASVLWSCVPTITPTPILTANVSSFSNGCLSCDVILSPSAGSQVNLNWKATSTGISGVSFNPSSGTLKPGQVIHVMVSVPPQNCPASTTFDFVGPGNTASVPWSCSASPSPTPGLTVGSSSLDPSNCSANGDGTYTCTVSVGETGQGNLSWSASSSVGGTISPASGQLSAGQTQQSVTISSLPCQNGEITFNVPGSNSATVSWSCSSTPPPTSSPLTLSVSPSSLSVSNCSANSDGTYTCTVDVSESAQGDLGWSASSSVGGSFNPASGQLSAGQTQQSVTISSIPCQSGSFTFVGQNSNSVSVSWSCTPVAPTLTISPSNLDASSDCSYTDGTGFSCNVTLSTNADATSNLNWSVASGGSSATFTPSSGTLTPGQTTTVNLLIPDSASLCPFTNNFSITDQNGNSYPISFTCAAPSVSVQPQTMSSSSCTQNSDGSWTCSVTISLGQYNFGSLQWTASASGDNSSGVAFNPSSGDLTSDQSTTVIVTIPATSCPASTVFSFSYNQTSSSVDWSC